LTCHLSQLIPDHRTRSLLTCDGDVKENFDDKDACDADIDHNHRVLVWTGPPCSLSAEASYVKLPFSTT